VEPDKGPAPRRVLVVDDEDTTLAVIQATLEDLGYEVTTRNRAFGTSAVIVDERPDIVLIDIEMPGLSGDGIVRLIRESPSLRSIVFILHSGARAADLERLTRETGAAGAIVKTGDLQDFSRQFERLVREHVERPGQ
jgi:CheY-like chemotaxis protein